MNPILQVLSIEPDLVKKDGTTQYIAIAVLQDVYKVRTSLLDPAEWRPGQCSCCFEVDPGEEHPPLEGSAQDQLSYLDDLDLDWKSDDDEEPLI